MDIAQLFVSLGIKGSEKTLGALVSVEHKFSDLKSISLETKAAILGSMYALEQFFAKSGAQGTALTNLNTILGISTKTIQQYEYAARQMGVANEETDSTLKGLQNTFSNTFLGKGAPSGLGLVANKIGGGSAADIRRYMQSPDEGMQWLAKYAQAEKNDAIRNQVLKSFGLSDNMIAAMARGAFTQKNLAQAPTYGDAEIKALDKANIGWSNLLTKIEMAIGHFNARFGVQLQQDFDGLITRGLKLVSTIVELAEKFHLFQLADLALKQVDRLINEVADGLLKVGNFLGEIDQKYHIFDTMKKDFEALSASTGQIKDFFKDLGTSIADFADKTNLFKHGKDIFSDIIGIMTQLGGVLKEVGIDLAKINDQFKVWENFEKFIDGFLSMMNILLKTVQVLIGGETGDKIQDDAVKTMRGSTLGNTVLKAIAGGPDLESLGKVLSDNLGGPLMSEGISAMFGGSKPNLKLAPPPSASSSFIPPKMADGSAKNSPPNVNINQNFNFPPNTDQKSQASELKKAVNDGFRQSWATFQGN